MQLNFKSKYNELFLRIITGLGLIAIGGLAVYFGGIVLWLLLGLLAIGLIFEFVRLINAIFKQKSISYFASLLIGIAYIAFACLCFALIRQMGETDVGGRMLLLMVIIMVVGFDTGGYVFGKILKGPKLSPALSPNKTWSGFLGGIFMSGFILFVLFGFQLAVFPMGVFIGIIAQGGDLFESSLKRKAGVKDSGTFLPGHGGLLDRFDSYLFAVPCYYLIMSLLVA